MEAQVNKARLDGILIGTSVTIILSVAVLVTYVCTVKECRNEAVANAAGHYVLVDGQQTFAWGQDWSVRP